MITKDHLFQRVQIPDVSNWIRETKSISYQNKWDVFKKQIQENDQLWSYQLKEVYKNGLTKRLSQGYAIVRNDQVVNAFETAYS